MSDRIFVTADTHFGYAAAIEVFNRACSDVAEMNDILIERINEVVGPDDVLYHLGDFVGPIEAGSTTRYAESIRERIACRRIILVLGNHDPRGEERFDRLFESVHEILSMKGWRSGEARGKERLVLSHYAIRIWQGRHNGSLHLYGHSHGTLDEIGRSTDIGIDCWSLYPQPLEAVLAMLRERQIDLAMARPRVQPVRGG